MRYGEYYSVSTLVNMCTHTVILHPCITFAGSSLDGAWVRNGVAQSFQRWRLEVQVLREDDGKEDRSRGRWSDNRLHQDVRQLQGGVGHREPLCLDQTS